MKFHALVLGVNKFDNGGPYPHPLRHLEGCVADAVGICKFLVTKVKVPPANVQLLLSAPEVEGLPEGVIPSDARTATLHDAFDRLIADVEEADGEHHVVIYFATHGVRLQNDAGDWSYVLVPQDFPAGLDDWSRMVPTAQLNHYLRRLTQRANVSVISDTCHSAGSTRDVGDDEEGTRGIKLPQATPAQWVEFTKAHAAWAEKHGADVSPVSAQTRSASGLSVEGDKDWVLFAACRDSETAKEWPLGAGVPASEKRGLFTSMLLRALDDTTADSVGQLRWLDIQARITADVASSVGMQTPTLEGRSEATVFGGAWTQFEPGYLAKWKEGGTPAAPSNLDVDGGLVHGLDVGAVIDLYPAGTARFVGVKPTGRAEIVWARPTRAGAKLLEGEPPGADEATGARARLRTPSSKVDRMRVRVPASLREAVLAAEGVANFVEVVTGDTARFEVCPWETNGAPRAVRRNALTSERKTPHDEGGWVLVAVDAVARLQRGVPLSEDDVIAYLPPAGGDFGDAHRVGAALGEALVHWARYQLILRQVHKDGEALGKTVTPELLVGELEPLQQLLGHGRGAAPAASPDAEGVHHILGDDGFTEPRECHWLALRLTSTQAPPVGWDFFVGAVFCSDEGATFALGAPGQGGNVTTHIKSAELGALGDGGGGVLHRVVFIGDGQKQPFCVGVRDDQQFSTGTIKVVAVLVPKGDPGVDMSKFVLDNPDKEGCVPTVQGMITDAWDGSRAGPMGRPAKPPSQPLPLCYTWELKVRAHRPSSPTAPPRTPPTPPTPPSPQVSEEKAPSAAPVATNTSSIVIVPRPAGAPRPAEPSVLGEFTEVTPEASRSVGGEATVELGADEQLVGLHVVDGVARWLLPTGPEESRGGGERRLVIPLGSQVGAADDGGRGIAADGITFLLRYTATPALSFLGGKLVERHEARLYEGPVVLDNADPTQWAKPPHIGHLAKPGGHVLVLLHGTFSSTVGSFARLAEGAPSPLEGWRKRYDAVIGFDHHTLSRTPKQNAEKILGYLQELPDVTFDVLCYSRGGLVGRVLTEQVMTDAERARVKKLVGVATTFNGTVLAQRANWNSLLDRMTNLAMGAAGFAAATGAAAVVGPVLAVAGGVVAMVKAMAEATLSADGIPGIAAMDPDGEVVRGLQAGVGGVGAYVTITSSFESSSGAGMALADKAIDRLFDEANDLVVNMKSTQTLPSTLAKPEHLVVAAKSGVHHVGFFGDPEVQGWLRDKLTGRPAR